MADVDRSAHTRDAALYVHAHRCPECGATYSCNCSEQDRKTDLVCINCEREGN